MSESSERSEELDVDQVEDCCNLDPEEIEADDVESEDSDGNDGDDAENDDEDA
ncbi:MAG: protein jag, partial [Cutibacterium sp.]|nr:protein jag [Cutibacterium sp.]